MFVNTNSFHNLTLFHLPLNPLKIFNKVPTTRTPNEIFLQFSLFPTTGDGHLANNLTKLHSLIEKVYPLLQ